jgi:hypothetical protein
MISFGAIALLLLLENMQSKTRIRTSLMRYPFPLRLVFYNLIIVAILLYGNFSNAEFIYFQF